jgi:hypothetical protein
LRTYSLGIAVLVAIVFSVTPTPNQSIASIAEHFQVAQADFGFQQTGSVITILVKDKDPTAIDSVLVDGVKLESSGDKVFNYDMGQEISVDVSLASDSEHSDTASDPLRHVTSHTFPVQNLSLPNSAVAQSSSATRTRIRYQTYIGSDFVIAPPPCTGAFHNVTPFTYFTGNGRSWDADSDSYKTRFDSIITWGADPNVKKEVSVGESQVVFGVPPFDYVVEARATASSQSMQLQTTVLSPEYVSFGIKQNVPNPFCIGADGINFDLHFYVRRDGVYTLSGNYLPVPYHEVYARDNVDPSWRQILRGGSELFICFTPLVGNVCDVNALSQRSAF